MSCASGEYYQQRCCSRKPSFHQNSSISKPLVQMGAGQAGESVRNQHTSVSDSIIAVLIKTVNHAHSRMQAENQNCIFTLYASTIVDVISDAPILVDLTDPKTSLQCPPKRLNWADVIAENSTEKALHRLIQAGQQAPSGRNPPVPNNKAPLVLP